MRNRDIIEIKESMVSSIEEGLGRRIIVKELYARTDKGERNLRKAEKNHPEYNLKNVDFKSKNEEGKMSPEQKAFALRSRDLTEARTMIKNYQKSTDKRERLDLLQEIYTLLETMPKEHAKTRTKNNIYSSVGFGAFMYSFAVPLLFLFGTENSAFVTAVLSASAGLASFATIKTKRGINYAKNMLDGTYGVIYGGKSNLKSSGKRDRFSGELEKYRGIKLDVDSEKEEAKIRRRKEIVNKIVNKLKGLIDKEKKKLSGRSSQEEEINKERLRVGRLVREGYFDDFNSIGDFVINEEGMVEEGIVKAGVKTLVLTTAILMGMSHMGISKQQVASTLKNAGANIVRVADSNVDDMRDREDNISKGLVITWDSGKKVLGTLKNKLAPIARKTASFGGPALESAGADLISKTSSIASGLIDGFVKDEKINDNLRRQLMKISNSLKEISRSFGEESQNKSQEVTSKLASAAMSQINKAENLIPDSYRIPKTKQ